MAKDKGSGVMVPFEVQKYLAGADYPMNKEDLIQFARENDAPDEVMQVLERLPDREYDKPTDVTKEMAKLD